MPEPYVITIILNTNRRTDTMECLASLMESSYGNHKTIVLDNHSTDGSVAAISAAFPTVQIIELTENLGYAGNNNVGIQAAFAQGAEWVFVLNEDTVLHSDCLAHLIEIGESNPHIGIVGPMVYHHDEPTIIQSGGGKLSRSWDSVHIGQNEPDQGQLHEPRRVDWISGCAILVRRKVIEQVGMIDARFFYYWEETEWCVRAGKAGWQILHVPQAKLWHKGVQRNYRPKPAVTYYSTRNRLLLLAKHHAPLMVQVAVWGQLLRTMVSWTVKPKWRAMREHRNAMWHGMSDFLRQRWGQMPS
ncbi:MAG: glycosyltransferase family 2 protein [Caldilineaceae bacterium]